VGGALPLSQDLQVRDNRLTRDTFVRGHSAEDRTERAESEWMVVRDRDPVVSRFEGFQDDVAADLVHPRVLPSAAQDVSEMRGRRREGSSCHQQDLIADEVETNSIGARSIKEERGGRFQHVLA
jgi:hypothetical protein